MDKTDYSDFKSLFIDTARKDIETMKSSLAALMKSPVDTDVMNRIYIASHSLKGKSLAMGYMTNATVAQLIEKIFYSAKDGTIKLNPQILSTVLRSVEKLSESIDCVEKTDKECIVSDARTDLEKVSGISLQ